MVRLKSLINLMLCMSLVGGKKPEYPEKPHRPREVADGRSTPKLVPVVSKTLICAVRYSWRAASIFSQ